MVASALSKASLSPSRRQLLLLMQRLNFGRIEGLVVKDGDPVLNLPPRVVREVKFGGDNDPRPQLQSDDFLLKARVVDLYLQMDRLRNGTLQVLAVKHGLPFSMELEERVA